jgi:alpha-beta hydrolase superfamily lysophospholipase
VSDWWPDLLGPDHEQHTIALGRDPDGEGYARATLVRRISDITAQAAVLYVHGFSDYFFCTELADFFTERDIAFYAIDLRKCGRALNAGQTPHYASTFELYDAELNAALDIITAECGVPVLVGAHSTGGLITALWLHRIRPDVVVGQFLNSPWFDLQGPAWTRSYGTHIVKAMALAAPKTVLPLPAGDAYGSSLHASKHGEFDFDTDLKPLTGFPVTVGWLAAVRRAQARLHQGLDVAVPSLVMKSGRSRFLKTYSDAADSADLVLDVRQIGKWSGCLGNQVTVVPIDAARHDVFLSLEPVRKEVYSLLDRWVDAVLAGESAQPAVR